MGLYLCILDDDEDEITGLDVGSYADFGVIRDSVCSLLEGGVPGARFPTFMRHSDCDGVWTPVEAERLRSEVAAITEALKQHPPLPDMPEWQRSVSRQFGLPRESLFDCFFDVDGEPLFDRLAQLCRVSIEKGRPILFQ